MSILKRSWLCLAILLSLVGGSWAQGNSTATSKGETLPPNRVVSLRSSQQVGKVRLVLETAQAPDYQIYQQDEHLIIEIFEVGTSPQSSPRVGNDGFVSKSKAYQPALGLFRWDLTCRYALPPEQLKVSTLDQPHRLVVDMYTNWVEDEHFQLTEGVSWHRRQYFGQTFPYLLWNQLDFDPQDPHIKVDIGFGQDSLSKTEPVSSIVKRKQALAGINGGYFNMSGGLLSLTVRNGQIVCPHVSRRPPRSVFGLTADKRAVFDRVKAVKGQLLTLDNKIWPNVQLAVGGGPRLLKNGAPNITTAAEALGPGGNDITRSCGRTAVSSDSRGHLAFSTASGLQDSSLTGLKLEQMADLLKRSGAVDAVNLDGGGSVDMSIQGEIVGNGPQAGRYERPVGDALLLFDDRPTLHPAKVDLQIDHPQVDADGTTHFELLALVTDAQGHTVADGTPVYFQAPGIQASRALTVSGQARVPWTAPRVASPVTVTASSGCAKGQSQISLRYGKPCAMWARWFRQVKGTSVLSAPASSLPEAAPTPMFDFGNGTALSSTPEDARALETSLQGQEGTTAPVSKDGGQPSTDGGQRSTASTSSEGSLGGSPTSTVSLSVQVIDFRARLEDKWHNGVPQQTVELWQNGQLVGTYTSNELGEVSGTVQLPLESRDIELRCAGLQPVKMVFM